jgi:hypothetical protein
MNVVFTEFVVQVIFHFLKKEWGGGWGRYCLGVKVEGGEVGEDEIKKNVVLNDEVNQSIKS